MAKGDLVLDFSNLMADRLGPTAVTPEEIDAHRSAVAVIHKGLEDLRRLGQLPFRDLPYREAAVEAIRNQAAEWRASFQDFLLIGIGGSALGPRLLQKALLPPFVKLQPRQEYPRLFLCDHLDSAEWMALGEMLDFRKTLILVISKSGQTTETLAAFLYFRERLRQTVGEARWPRHFVFVTDPHEGLLHRLAEEKSIPRFDVPPGVGGRYAVLSPVGLLPAALLGIDIAALLAGARRMDELCGGADPWTNPALLSALLLFLYQRRGRTTRVMLPYGEALKYFGDWFAQLWGESLGKEYNLKGEQVFAGSTPVRAVGVGDQHSQLQLYLEGPRDKVVTFVDAVRDRAEVVLPERSEDWPELASLRGRSVSALQTLERQATELALVRKGRPNGLLLLPDLSAHSLGQLIFFAELETVYFGEMLNVNPFDQPAVETIKNYVGTLLGRPPSAAMAEEIKAIQQKKTYRIP